MFKISQNEEIIVTLQYKNKNNLLNLQCMARPIADTPVLTGKDALRFMQAMANVKPISKKRRKEMERNYQLAKSMADFPL